MRVGSLLCLCLATSPVCPAANAEPSYLKQAHAHNDYWHDRPLLDALDAGFSSVEADIFLHKGRLLVGHDPSELKPDRDLETLYLKPLARKVVENLGEVLPGCKRFILMIDIKSERQPTYAALRGLLERYASILTTVTDGKANHGPLSVVITSGRPRVRLAQAGTRYAGIDGRLTDLDSEVPAYEMPLISDRWPSHFTWDGRGHISEGDRQKLHEVVRKAHERGRLVRFWATPENDRVWRELLDAGVDLINTDELAQLRRFLTNPEP